MLLTLQNKTRTQTHTHGIRGHVNKESDQVNDLSDASAAPTQKTSRKNYRPIKSSCLRDRHARREEWMCVGEEGGGSTKWKVPDAVHARVLRCACAMCLCPRHGATGPSEPSVRAN